MSTSRAIDLRLNAQNPGAIVAQNPEEQVDPREVVLAAHRPERHHAERRGRIGPEPIEKDVTRVGARRGRPEAALPRERADGKPGDQRGPQRMRGSLVLVEEQVDVGNQGDGREQRRRTKRARHRPVARRGDDPSSGDSPQRMSERRRHPNDPTGGQVAGQMRVRAGQARSDTVRPGSTGSGTVRHARTDPYQTRIRPVSDPGLTPLRLGRNRDLAGFRALSIRQ